MNAGDTCPEPEVIQRFALGWLAEEQSLALEQHLGGCPHCVRWLRAADAQADPLVLALRHPPAGPLVAADTVETLRPVLEALCPEITPRPPGETTGSLQTLSPDEGGEAGQPLTFLSPGGGPGELGVLGGYRIRRILGAGGMGIVLLADDPRLHREVAIKVIQPHLARRADVRERFLREARTVAAIEHDNIVTVYRADEEHGTLYLAMPLLRGESLESRLVRAAGPLPLRAVLQIGREAAAGLAAAHQRGILHRDVKPGNLWLEERSGAGAFRVKLLDFGLAHWAAPEREAEGAGGQGSIVGTPSYMAPEQACGEAIDARADLFSLGCVLYRAATGRLPFTGKGVLPTLAHQADPLAPQGVPAELGRLIVRLLARQPEGRPASAREVVQAIEAIEQKHFGSSTTRRRWLAGAALAGAGVAGGLTWWLAGPQARPDDPAAVSLVLDEPGCPLVLVPDEGEPLDVGPGREVTLQLAPGSYALRPARKEDKRTVVPPRLVVKPGEQQRLALRLVGERREITLTHAVWAVALAPVKGTLLALAGGNDQVIAFWDAAQEDAPTFLRGHKSAVRCLAFSADGRLAYSGSGDRRRPPDCSLGVWDLKKARLIRRLVEHDNWINCLALAPQAPLLAWGAADGVAALCDRHTGKKHAELTGDAGTSINSIAFAPDGNQVLTGGSDHLLRLWDAATGKRLHTLSGHTDAVRGVAVSPAGTRTASAGDDGTVRLWDLARGRVVRVLEGHQGPVHAVAWASEERLVSGGSDGTVCVWSAVDDGEPLVLRGHKAGVHALACSGDGRQALSGSSDWTVRLWDLPV